MATVRGWRDELEDAAWRLHSLLERAQDDAHDALGGMPSGSDEYDQWEEIICDRIDEAVDTASRLAADLAELGYDSNGDEVFSTEAM